MIKTAMEQVTAYEGHKLSGKVIATFARGREVFREGHHAAKACGAPLFPVEGVARYAL